MVTNAAVEGKEVVVIHRYGEDCKWFVEGRAVIVKAHPDDIANGVDSY